MANYKRNKDGYYRATFVVGKKPDGKPERITIRDKNLQVFKLKLDEAKRLHSKGITLTTMTVNEWSEKWIKVYKANASEVQIDHYKAKLKYDIIPYIGSMKVIDVRPSHLQELLNKYKGHKKGTVQKIRIAVKQLFDDAETEGIIERNPARHLELPDLTEDTRRPLTDLERAILYEVSKTHQRGTYALTMLFCGLRRGECIALKVGDVDFQKNKIRIIKSIRFSKNTKRKNGTKSEAGIREVPIPDMLIPFLETLCKGRTADAALFARTDDTHATEQACRSWWKSIVRQCHIVSGATVYRNQVKLETSKFDDDVTPHYLRHTYATDLYAAGIDDVTQKHFLGHSKKDVTDRYRKITDAVFIRARDLLNEYYKTKIFDPKEFEKSDNERIYKPV